jgi:hypothetical protein
MLGIASPQLVRDIHGHVPGPAFGSVESDDAHGIFILPIEQISDQRRAVSSRLVGLPPCPTERAEIVQHYVSIFVPIGRNRRRATHY